MSQLLPGFSPGPRSIARQWHSLDDYQNVHEAYMSALIARHIVDFHTLRFAKQYGAQPEPFVELRGRVYTISGSILGVQKKLDLRERARDNRPEVRAWFYSYHAWMPDENDRELFRYDNCHEEHRAYDGIHRHRFFIDGSTHSVEVISYEQLPNLDSVIEEAHRLGLIRPVAE